MDKIERAKNTDTARMLREHAGMLKVIIEDGGNLDETQKAVLVRAESEIQQMTVDTLVDTLL